MAFFFKTVAEIAVGLAVVMAWAYVALTLPDPARAATPVIGVTQAASNGEPGPATEQQPRKLVARRWSRGRAPLSR